jgi:hypothetical protein
LGDLLVRKTPSISATVLSATSTFVSYQMSEELSLPSLDLIQPGAFKDAAACDRLRDAIASECEALLQRFEAEKEVRLGKLQNSALDILFSLMVFLLV